MKWTKTRCFDIKFIGFSHRLIVVAAPNVIVIVVLSARTRVKQTNKCKHKWHTYWCILCMRVIKHLYVRTPNAHTQTMNSLSHNFLYVFVLFPSKYIFFHFIILLRWIRIVRNHEFIEIADTHREFQWYGNLFYSQFFFLLLFVVHSFYVHLVVVIVVGDGILPLLWLF